MTPSSNESFPSPPGPGMADSVARLAPAVVGLHLGRHSASGVWWQPEVVVTSASAVWRARDIALVLPGGEPVRGSLRGVDPATDLAAISFSGPTGFQAAPRAGPGGDGTLDDTADEVRVGNAVFALGREASGLVHASFGHIGAVAGEWRSWRGGRIERLIRLDGGLYSGLAGAAVGDDQGRLLGIASPAFSRQHGVVLPNATVDRVLAALLTHGRVPRGYLGIAAQPVRAILDDTQTEGLLISSIADDSPATHAGLMVGDVIVSLGDQPVRSIDALRDALGGDQVGRELNLRVARGGQSVSLSLSVSERPASDRSSRCR